ncbi:hypothetical protein EDB92DRAFT_1818405 [Lactarius akahatsu]|uniref:Uncharacterized protein n=1 Tax=Lactarius akahatsu TaxID=416441 RepID=A0AAD4QAR5_9AGAM|nr:hypothetical protein EDB92DRAFT_1818405 [Lactarius akahatsu]
MSPRPVRKIIPTAKLTADNAGDLELMSHRIAVASASAALTAPQLSRTPATSSPLPESSPPPPTDTEDASSPAPHLAQARTSSKRPSCATTKSHDSVITVSSTTSDDASEVALVPPKFKKPKTLPSDQEAEVHTTDFSIINIDDIEDPENKRLNKSHPSADIKYFFTALPRIPGQAKQHKKCNLCTQGLGCTKVEKIITSEHSTLR